MKFLITLILLALSGMASAQTACPKIADNKVHLCWDAPITFTDGTSITGAITYTVQRQSGTTWANDASNITATDWTSGVLTPGTYTYRVLAVVAAVSSDPSNTTSKTTTNPQPNPPGNLVIAQVTITITVECATELADSCSTLVAQR